MDFAKNCCRITQRQSEDNLLMGAMKLYAFYSKGLPAIYRELYLM